MNGIESFRNKVLRTLTDEGISIVIKKINRRICGYLDRIIQRLFNIIPIKPNYIVLESEGDYWDNARAFYEYLISNQYNKKYKIIWFVHDPKQYEENENVKFVSRFSNGINIVADYYIATASCFFFTHPYWLKKWRKGQTVINMTHSSMMLKAGGKNISDCFNYMLCASEAVKELKKKTYYISENQAVILGGPRIDLLYHPTNCFERVIPDFKRGKVILTMSTFKQTKYWNDSKSVDRFALNVINSEEELIALNDFLEINNTYLIMKIHHLQDMSFINVNRLKRIIYLIDSDLQSNGIQLYEMIGEADALITDYSSVFYDYLIVDRPIGFLISDIEDYSRGFCVDDPLEDMVGNKIKNIEQLYEFILSINNGVDLYKKQREVLRNKVHYFQDDKNSERLLKWVESKEIVK